MRWVVEQYYNQNQDRDYHEYHNYYHVIDDLAVVWQQEKKIEDTKKRKQNTIEEKQYIDKDLYPKTKKELLFEQRVKYWKDRISNILISPFNNNNWFKVSVWD